MADEQMDREAQIQKLNDALKLQSRSVLQYTLVAGAVQGFQYAALADPLWSFAVADLEDARRLVEKVSALGGKPTSEVAQLRSLEDPTAAVDWLIEAEGEALAALEAAIESTGREAASEAIEHRIEHIIMRKQEQLDYLLRARGRA